MMRVILAFLLSVFVFTACVSVVALQKENPLGKIYTGSIQLGDKIIPLPQGEWEVMASGTRKNFYITYLIKGFGENKFSYVKITVDGLPENDTFYSEYAASEQLDREDMHHVFVKNNIAGESQDGWYIDNITPYFGSSKKDLIKSQAAHFIRQNYHIVGNNYIKVSHRLTGKSPDDKYLVVDYCYNPEEDGFEFLPVTDWKSSDWNVMRIIKDPKKEAFVEKLKKEHMIFHEKIKEDFGV